MKTYTITKEIRDAYGDVIDTEELDTFNSLKKARKTAISLNEESESNTTYCILVEYFTCGNISGYEYIEADEL